MRRITTKDVIRLELTLLIKDPIDIIGNEVDSQTKRLHQIYLLVESVEDSCIFHSETVVSDVSQAGPIIILDGFKVLSANLSQIKLFKLVLITWITKFIYSLVGLGAKYDLSANDLILISEKGIQAAVVRVECFSGYENSCTDHFRLYLDYFVPNCHEIYLIFMDFLDLICL